MTDEMIRVLLVEDDPGDRELIRHALVMEGGGFRIFDARDREAFETLLAKDDYDAVLTDFNILGFEGLEVLRAVTRLRPETPVIVVTGTGSEEVAVKALKEGAADYVIKTPRHIAQLPITVRRALEAQKTRRELRQMDVNFRTLVANSADGIVVVNHQGTVVHSNPVAEDLLGSPAEHLEGREFAYHFTVGQTVEIELPNRRGGVGTAEMRVAETFWNEEPCFIVSLRDVTIRKRAEDALRESRQKFQSIVENIGVGVALISPNMEVLELNRRMRTWFPDVDLDRPPICYRTFNDPPRETVCDYCPAIHTLRDGRVHETTTDTPHKDGIRHYRLVASPIFDARGVVSAVIETVEDVTVQLSTEAQLRQVRKLEAIGTLAGGVAHDFNNILYAMLGNTEIIKGRLPADSELMPRVEEVLRAGERAKDLIRQILSFSRRSESPREEIRCIPIVEETVRLLRATLPSTVEIQFDLQCGCDAVLSNPTEIQQIVMNLCTNAVQAIGGGPGAIEIRLENRRLSKGTAYHRFVLKPGDYLLLTVCDTGCGIDPRDLERIFEPFFTLKPPGAGTGLGLSVVHGIVRELGGGITVESEPERGTTFQVFLPTVEPSVSKGETTVEEIPSGSGTILLVDDEPVLLDLQAEMLRECGYEVVTQTCSLAALEVFENNPHAFDLVITDQTMPQIAGDQLVEKLLRIRPDLPVIICTGFSARITEDRIRETGVRKLLMKPVSKGEMARCVSEILTGGGAERPGPSVDLDPPRR